jgi:competence protein ComEC
MLRIALPFVTGLLLGGAIDPRPHVLVPLALLATTVWIILTRKPSTYGRRWWNGAMLMVVLAVFGMAWQSARSTIHRPNALARGTSAIDGSKLRVFELIGNTERTTRCWADVQAVHRDGQWARAQGRVLVTLMKDSLEPEPEAGAMLVLRCRVDTIDRVPDPGGFDQGLWARSYGAYHECFASQGKWTVLTRSMGALSWIADVRGHIVAWLKASDLPQRERGMVKAILLGIRDELDRDQKTAFSRSGTMHVLAVSGSHVALIYGALLVSLGWLGERLRWRVFRSVLILVILWIYAGITGFSPSVLRATATFSLVLIADMTPWRSQPVNSLAAAAFLLLLWDPLMLWQLSFQLSFLAVLGISFFYKPIMWAWAAPNTVLHYFWSLFAVSIAAQAFTTPLALYWFKAFPVWFLPANLVIVGLVSLGVYGGVLLLLLHSVPVVGQLITAAMKGLLLLLGWTSDFFAYLPGAYPSIRVDAFQCLLLYVLILLAAAWIFERWKWTLRALLGTLVVLLISWGYKARTTNVQDHFVVYDDREHLACAWVHGRSLTILSDTTDEWLDRKVESHVRSCGASVIQRIDSIPQVMGRSPDDVIVVHASDPKPRARSFPPRAVVLDGRGRFDMETLQNTLAPRDGFILAPSLPARQRSFIRHWCSSHGLRVHDVRTQGAYVR